MVGANGSETRELRVDAIKTRLYICMKLSKNKILIFFQFYTTKKLQIFETLTGQDLTLYKSGYYSL